MNRAIATCVAAIAAFTLLSTPVNARRTVVDVIDGVQYQYDLAGYCDLDGLDCVPSKLPYSVDFNDGNGSVNSVLLYGNGVVAFGTPPIPISQLLTGPFEDATYAHNAAVITSFNDDVVDGGFLQIGSMNVQSDGRITALFETCADLLSCYSFQSDLQLTPTTTGFIGVATFAFDGFGSVEYRIPGQPPVDVFDGNPISFFIPATIDFSVTPEPGTWALMVGGMGLTGYAMRRRRAFNAVA